MSGKDVHVRWVHLGKAIAGVVHTLVWNVIVLAIGLALLRLAVAR